MKSKITYRKTASAFALLMFAGISPAQAALDSGVDYTDQSVENALNLSDYQRADKVLAARLKGAAKGTISEAYLHVAFFESLLWQGSLSQAQSEAKRVNSLLGKLPENDQTRDLKLRFWSSWSWLLEQIGQDVKAKAVLQESIDTLQKFKVQDKQAWLLPDALSHLASLDAQAGDYEQAINLLTEALKHAQASSSIDAYNIADLEEALGGVLFKAGKAAEAKPHFDRALALKVKDNSLLIKSSPHEYWLSPVYRYIPGSPWSQSAVVGGLEHLKIDAGAVSVEAYLVKDKSASKRTVRVGLVIENRSNVPVEFLGQKPELFALDPKIAVGEIVNAASLAGNVENKTNKKANSIRSAGQNATRTVTTYYPNMYNNNGSNGRGRQGFWRSLISDSGNIGTTQVPDFQATERAMQKAQQVEDDGRALAEEIRQTGIGHTDIPPGAKLAGFLFFDMKTANNASRIVFKLPVGDTQFEFRFARLP